MPAPPIETRIERLPNWAQAYIGRMSRQIMQLKERMGNFTLDPTPVYSTEVIDGEEVVTYLPISENKFTIETLVGPFEIELTSYGINIRSDIKYGVVPVGGNISIIALVKPSE